MPTTAQLRSRYIKALKSERATHERRVNEIDRELKMLGEAPRRLMTASDLQRTFTEQELIDLATNDRSAFYHLAAQSGTPPGRGMRVSVMVKSILTSQRLRELDEEEEKEDEDSPRIARRSLRPVRPIRHTDEEEDDEEDEDEEEDDEEEDEDLEDENGEEVPGPVRKYRYDGEIKSISQWASDARCPVGRDTLRKRLDGGWKFNDALLTPAGIAIDADNGQ